MSKENLEQFMEQVAGSEELQAKIGEEIDAEALIALGAECGCEFTAEELQESAELSDEELDGVAGGALKRGARATVTSGWVEIPDTPINTLMGTTEIPYELANVSARHGKRIKVNIALTSNGQGSDH